MVLSNIPFFINNFRVRSKAYRYWFFMFNLLHEYLECSVSSIPCDLTDFKSVEKCFGNSEVDVDVNDAVKAKLKSSEIISVIKQFIESSNFGEFCLRMDILKSFEFYLQYVTIGSNAKRKSLIAIIHNLHMYYAQFVTEIEEIIKSKRTPIEKKLKDFVKIESYNKDLSYYSMKNNVARVHRHLHKFLREFETVLLEKIATVFVWRANEIHALVDESTEKRIKESHHPNITSYMIDVDMFIASLKLKGMYCHEKINSNSNETSNLLTKVDKLFSTSRNIVKQAILHVNFPTLIYNFDAILANQIETCHYLRKLEVDRTQEKPKQKSQAKQILQQKRKALADSYKLLTTFGLSFRSGLLEMTLQKDLVDLKIIPFSEQTLIDATVKHKKISQNVLLLNENMDSRYSKCIFKLKLLQTIMLTPNPELGLQNIERIKGFAVDLFLLVQRQRQSLSKSSIELQKLQQNIDDITGLHEISLQHQHNFKFIQLSQQFDGIKRASNQIMGVVKQYEILLKTVAVEEDQTLRVIISSNVSAFTQNSDKYKNFNASLSLIAKLTTDLLNLMESKEGVIFHSSIEIGNIKSSFDHIVHEITELKNTLKISNSNDEYLVFAKPLDDLLCIMDADLNANGFMEEKSNDENNYSFENIQVELENIVHHILLSMQNIYKKYSIETENTNDVSSNTKQSVEESELNSGMDEDDDDDESDQHNIEENHLKQKISNEMLNDLKTLGLSAILSKLSSIITVIRYAANNNETSNTSAQLECIQKIASIAPILEQFKLLCQYYLIQQFGAYKVSAKMLNVMLTVFIELGAKGFCVPPDLMTDEDGEQNNGNDDGKEGEGFGLEDGTGENDVSDK